MKAARRVLGALALGLAVSAAVTAVSRVGALAGWETRAVDAFLFFRDRVASPEIVLVVIDEDAFHELGERQPIPRGYLAELGEFLLAAGARVVAFDIHVRARSTAAEDGALLAMARRWDQEGGGRLVFTSVATPRPGTAPPRYEVTPAFSPALAATLGFANAPVGGDGVIRRMAPVLAGAGGDVLPSFALAVLAAHAGQPRAALAAALRGEARSTVTLPFMNAAGQIAGAEPVPLGGFLSGTPRIDFVGEPGTFPSFPVGPLVAMARSGARPDPDNPFRGKIVLVGATFQESRDFFPTPKGLMPGVEIQANMIHTLLARRALAPPPWGLNVALLLALCLAVALLSLWLRPLSATLAILGLLAGFLALSWEAYTRGYWLDFVAPLVAMMAYLQSSRLLARRRLRAAFGQFVSPEVVDRVMREGSELGGEVRMVTVLMSDLRGFTTLSEKLPPERISATINDYMTAMVEVILAHHGMVQDFIGDGILAVFGAPLDDPEHAFHAVATTVGMQRALAGLNRRWEAEGRPTLAMGAAVHTGRVFVGNVGSPRRKKYSVLGDPVNTASRIEGLNRELGTTILISGATRALVADRVVVRDRGTVHVKGRTEPVELFELVELREDAAREGER